MGRSEPSFVVEECTDKFYADRGVIENYEDESEIRAVAKMIKARNIGCWKHEDFKLIAPNGHKYHFLEYSGTRQVAEDMERFRKLFGDQKASLYGVSYGTQGYGNICHIVSSKCSFDGT